VESLLKTGAEVTVISPELTPDLKHMAELNLIDHVKRTYRKGDLESFILVVAATGDREVNAEIAAEAERSSILCNVVNIPELCNFYVPASFSRGKLQIAISTGGSSPLLAKKVRQDLERIYGPHYSQVVSSLNRFRKKVMEKFPLDDEKREEVYNSILKSKAFDYFNKGKIKKGIEEIEKWISIYSD
jgi:siroheme synthase-like protein